MSLQVYFDIPVNTFPVIQLVPTAQHSKLTDNRIIRPSSSTRHTKSICIPEVYCLSKHCDAPHTSTQETSTSPSTTQSTSIFFTFLVVLFGIFVFGTFFFAAFFFDGVWTRGDVFELLAALVGAYCETTFFVTAW